jgi:hypothetical protein
MKKIIAAALGSFVMFASAGASADVISASTYSLTKLTGNFNYGYTDWNGGSVVNNSAQLNRVEGILSDGYVANTTRKGTVNGIYSGYPDAANTIEFSFDGGVDYKLDSLTFLSSRSYSDATTVGLQYALNGGNWVTAMNTTAGALGITTGDAYNYTLNFGGVTADAFRLVLNGDQISFHEISVDGALKVAPAVVPEPTTVALLGLGLLGFAASRRKSGSSKNA